MTLNETTLVNANNNAARFVTLLAARVDAARSNLAGDLRRLVEEAQKAIEDLEAGRSWAAFGLLPRAVDTDRVRADWQRAVTSLDIAEEMIERAL